MVNIVQEIQNIIHFYVEIILKQVKSYMLVLLIIYKVQSNLC